MKCRKYKYSIGEKNFQRSGSGSFTPLYVVKSVFVCVCVIDKMPIAPPSLARTPNASKPNLLRWRKLRTPPEPDAAAGRGPLGRRAHGLAIIYKTRPAP